MKFILIIAGLLMSGNVFASNILMHENGAPMNSQPVEIVIVMGNEIQMRSSIYACSSYPGFPDKIYGDVYECHTSREMMMNHLGDNKMYELPDHELAQYILKMNKTFDCANRSQKPQLVSYKGKNVYWFIGLLAFCLRKI